MLLADAIEAWGQHHRDTVDPAELQRLAQVWRTVKNSDQGRFEIESMTKDDARAVMGLFEQQERAGVAAALSEVRKWSIARRGATTPAPVPHETRNEPSSLRDREPPPSRNLDGPSSFAAAAAATSGRLTPERAASIGDSDLTLASGDAGDPADSDEPDLMADAPLALRNDDGSLTDAAKLGLAIIGILVLIGLYFALTGDDDGQTVSTTPSFVEPDDSAVNAVASGTTAEGANSDFCAVLRGFEQQDPLAGLSTTDGELYFTRVDELWTGLSAIAPDSLAGDIGVIQRESAAFGALAAQFNYNFDDGTLGQAIAAVDTTALDASTARLDQYSADVCGIATGQSVGQNLDQGTGISIDPNAAAPAAAVAAVYESLGVTPELAECLSRELGGFDTASADSALLTKPVCGTSLVEVMSGISSN